MAKKKKSYPCPCCGFLTMESPIRNTFDICPVCGWEDDWVQYNNPECGGGANRESLMQAKNNYATFGAAHKDFSSQVRPPHPDEDPGVSFLDEFSHYLSDVSTIKIERIFEQNKALEYLIYLFNNRPDFEEFVRREMLFWPHVKTFFSRLFNSLDQALEPKAAEVFSRGCFCIASFIGRDNAYQELKSLLGILAGRFPRLQELYNSKRDGILAEFFRPTTEDFLGSISTDKFSEEFPYVYELFVSPIKNSSLYRTKKLFNFYCNGCIYGPIMDVLAERSSSLKMMVEKLEKNLKLIRLHSGEESWKELVDRSQEVLSASNQLEVFTYQSIGLWGEIETASCLAKKYPNDKLVFVRSDNRFRTRKQKRTCDLMVARHNENDLILVEVKSKIPRHGVTDQQACMWDDFFENSSGSIYRYLVYLGRNNPLVFGLSWGQAFPLLSMCVGSSYGKPLPLISCLNLQDHESDDSDSVGLGSEKKIEILLRSLFMKPRIFLPNSTPLGTDEERLAERHRQVEALMSKRCIQDPIQDGVNQLQEWRKRQLNEGHKVSGLCLSFVLCLSHRLKRDPLGHGDVDVGMSEELRGKFNECIKNLNLDCSFELLLPLEIQDEYGA